MFTRFNIPAARLFFLTVVVGSISTLFHSLAIGNRAPWHVVYSDILAFSGRALENGFPYLNISIEYPVLTGFFIRLAGYLGGDMLWYYLLSAAGCIVLACVITELLRRMMPPEDTIFIHRYWILAPSFIIFLVYNWDILAMAFVIAALFAESRGHRGFAAACLALGASTKLFPLFFLIPLLLGSGSGLPFRARLVRQLEILGVFAITAAIINAPVAIAAFDGWAHFFRFSEVRLPVPDSIWGIVIRIIPGLEVSSINLISFALFGALSLFALLRMQKAPFVATSAAITLAFLLTNKVFSPQYLLWLLPLFVLIRPPDISVRVLEIANLVSLWSILSWFFVTETPMTLTVNTLAVLVRHCMLAALFLWIVLRYSRSKSPSNAMTPLMRTV